MAEQKEIWVFYRLKRYSPKYGKHKRLKIVVKRESTVEARMIKLGEKYKDKEGIQIGYYVKSEISGTWMNMSAFYVSENRYVKF